jgi:hypothetical protein
VRGGSKRRATAGPVLLPALLLSAAATTGWSLELETVLENTAVTPPARVQFREERHNSMLSQPLVLTGYLEYLDEGRLRKVVETPFSESFLVDGDRIEFSRDGQVRSVALGRSKALQGMLAGIEAILAGRMDELSATFDYELSGTATAWTLQLKPRSRRLSQQLDSLQVRGDELAVTSIRFELKDDEWHLLEILKDERSVPSRK